MKVAATGGEMVATYQVRGKLGKLVALSVRSIGSRDL
jgi:hypothetical protein